MGQQHLLIKFQLLFSEVIIQSLILPWPQVIGRDCLPKNKSIKLQKKCDSTWE